MEDYAQRTMKVHLLPQIALIICISGICNSSFATERTVRLTPDSKAIALSPHSAWLQETGNPLSASEVVRSAHFSENTQPLINPGYSDAVVWARTYLHNIGQNKGRWIVSMNRFALPVCEIYLLRDGVMTTVFDGSQASYIDSFDRYGTLAGAIELESGQQGTLLVRYKGSNWSALDLTLHPPGELSGQQRRAIASLLVVFGVVLSLALYGAMTSTYLGWPIVILYVLAQLSFFGFFAHLTGFTTVYLWPGNPAIGQVVSPVLFGLHLICMAQFARLFFSLSSAAPAVDRTLQACVWSGCAALLLICAQWFWPAIDRQFALLILYPAALISWFVLPSVAGYATWRWNRYHWPLFAAWSATALYTILMVLVFVGWITTIPLGKQSYVLFVGLESVFLALALGLRIRVMRFELTDAEHRLRVSLADQLRVSEQRAWALQELAEKGRLLLATGHDARQMLFAMRTLTDKVRMADQPTHESADQLEAITQELEGVFTTAVNASYSGGIEDDVLCLDSISLSDLAEPLRIIYGDRAAQRGIDLRFSGSNRHFVTDRVLLLRALGNLVSNAVEHAHPTGIVVALRAHQKVYRVQVWDDGSGVESSRLSELTKHHEHLANGSDETYGSGVGLQIVINMAERLGGRLEARSQIGRGSCFELIIPTGVVTERGQFSLKDEDPNLRHRFSLVGEALGWTLQDSIEQDCGGLHFVDQKALPADDPTPHDFVVGMTYDRSAANRTQLSRSCAMVIYKPVDALQIREAIHFYQTWLATRKSNTISAPLDH